MCESEKQKKETQDTALARKKNIAIHDLVAPMG